MSPGLALAIIDRPGMPAPWIAWTGEKSPLANPVAIDAR